MKSRVLLSVVLSAVAVASADGSAQATAQAPTAVTDYWQPPVSKDHEDYVHVALPPGIQVIQTEMEGPVFADSNGRTLYSWELKNLRNGDTGDRKKSGASACTDEVYKETSGLESPYPAGLLLPELDSRPSCAKLWPPALAPADAKPVGKWNFITRNDGSKQWTYQDFPLYISTLDHHPGDVFGGTKVERANGSGVARKPVGPPPDVPPELAVVPFSTGHLLVDHKGASVYTSDADGPGKSNCDAKCLADWEPVMAPNVAVEQGEWSIVARSPGVTQWAYRKKPLYTYRPDRRYRSMSGSDVPGWHNVYTERALPPPAGFTVEDSRIGQVLADSRGRTVYIYYCSDDALDQQACDDPDSPQAYRLAICGNGDPKVCRATFPYVTASANAKSQSKLWSVIAIDPNTGHRAGPNQADALYVWAFRDRPVYTFAKDAEPGEANGDAYGEFNGFRDGFKAFWLRDDFRENSFTQ
jgi:predicted lipoprotein with Yx(FWY)xxD motif